MLLNETRELRKLLSAAHEEMQSIHKILATEPGRSGLEELELRRQSLLEKLSDLQNECVQFNRKAHNHKHDLQGMRECEDVSCEAFYFSEHTGLKKQIEQFLVRFEELKTGTIRYTADLLEQLS